MNLDLRDFTSFPAEATLEVEADSIEYGIEGIAFRDFMTVRLNIQKVDEEYYCHGSIMAPVEQECSRCLNNFDSELTSDFDVVVRTGEGKGISPGNGEEDVILAKAHEPVVELNDIIRQSLILSLPLKPLCSDECKGLCPNCGVDLNEESCECRREEVDERWEGLKDLLE